MKKINEKEGSNKKDLKKKIEGDTVFSTRSSHFQNCYKKNFNLLMNHYTRKNENSSQINL